MNSSVGLLAQLGSSGRTTTAPVSGGWWSNLMNSGLKEAGIVIGVLLALALVVFVFAKIFYKKPTKKRASYPKYQVGEDGLARPGADEAAHGGERRKRHHRRKRSGGSSTSTSGIERPRNPTLADTGGLPPLRDPGQNPEV